MPIDESRLLDLMEQGKVHFQDVVETSVLQANIRKDWMKFGAQVLVTVTAMAFSLTMTATHPGSEGIYIPIMTGILGYWLPSPDVPKSSAWQSTDVVQTPAPVQAPPLSVAVAAPSPVAAPQQPDAVSEQDPDPVPEPLLAPVEDVQMAEQSEHPARAKATRRGARAAQSE